MKKPWTQQEIEYVKMFYNKKSNTEIAKILGRSASSVQHKAARLNLTDTSKAVQGRPWTEEEEEYIIKYYEKRGCDFLAHKLKRTVLSVRRKAQNLGVSAYICEEIHVRALAECFQSTSAVVKRWIDKYGLPCRTIKRGQLEFRTIDVKSFWKWAESHKSIIPWNKYETLSLLPQPSWVNDEIKSYTSKKHRKPITSFEKSTVARMRRQGYNYKDIALELGRTVESVKHIDRSLKEVQK
jgi:DNA-binding CsgD family transcriptional regulator